MQSDANGMAVNNSAQLTELLVTSAVLHFLLVLLHMYFKVQLMVLSAKSYIGQGLFWIFFKWFFFKKNSIDGDWNDKAY